MRKKGQAALEFLMTYGWAILVVLIAIGALAYFGVLNPSRFLPSSCVLFPGLSCTDFLIQPGANGNVTLVVRNGMGEAIDGPVNFSMSAADCGAVGSNSTATLADGAELSFRIPCNTGTTASRFKADITIVFNSSTSGLQHTRTGQLVGQVE